MDQESVVIILIVIGVITWSLLGRRGTSKRKKQQKSTIKPFKKSEVLSSEYARNIYSYSGERVDLIVKGIWADRNRVNAFRNLSWNSILRLEFDFNNAYDKNAIAVKSERGEMLGYIERNRRKVIKTLKENPNNLAFIREKDQFYSQKNQREVYKLHLDVWLGYSKEETQLEVSRRKKEREFQEKEKLEKEELSSTLDSRDFIDITSGFRFAYKNINPAMLNVGSLVTLWPLSNQTTVLIYSNESIIRNKPIGAIDIEGFETKYPIEKFRVKSTVIGIDKDLIIIDADIEVENKTEEVMKLNDQFFEKIDKVAKKPLKTSINFYMPSDFRWNSKVYLSFGDVNSMLSHAKEEGDWELLKTCFWINDSNGIKISQENYTRKQDVLKVLRNYRSGHLVRLKYRKEQRDGISSSGGHYAWNCVYDE